MNAAPVAENAVLLSFGDAVDAALTPRIMALAQLIETELGQWIVDITPAYTTLLVTYDVLRVNHTTLLAQLERLYAHLSDGSVVTVPGRQITIPVWYDEAVGFDLLTVAQTCELSIEDVIARHTGTTYQVFALGFAPGFGFLGEIDERLMLPRRATPRTAVPAGSVAIAERQTAVYPRRSPGGWHVLGRTAMTLFNPSVDGPEAATLQVGDQVRFVAITRDEYLAQGGEL